MAHLEIEVKFYLPEPAPVRNRIIELGAASRGRVFETNLRFEDDRSRLIRERSLLRLRRDSATTLTFKYAPPGADKHFKVLGELEVQVSDFCTMKHILEALGFHVEQIYEKWRETFLLEGAFVCVDTMPYGDFLEIEGKPDTIKDLAARLGLRWEKRILSNYLEMFDSIRRKCSLDFKDVTFDRFRQIEMDFSRQIRVFEAES
jgi:adenylate cyclase class 2